MSETEKALAFNGETKAALETILGELNYGQRKKLYEDPAVRPILDRYGIGVEK